MLGDGRTFHRREAMEKGQAERLMPVLAQVLAEAGLGWADLDRLAVGTGPGNFTGVRISVAAARGLALGLGIPALGISRLEALAHGLPRPVTVVEDARREEAYVQHFGAEGAGTAQLCGRGALALSGAISGPVTGSAAGPDALPPAMDLTRAMAEIALERRLPQPRPAPFYLRGADAAPPADPPPVILP